MDSLLASYYSDGCAQTERSVKKVVLAAHAGVVKSSLTCLSDGLSPFFAFVVEQEGNDDVYGALFPINARRNSADLSILSRDDARLSLIHRFLMRIDDVFRADYSKE